MREEIYCVEGQTIFFLFLFLNEVIKNILWKKNKMLKLRKGIENWKIEGRTGWVRVYNMKEQPPGRSLASWPRPTVLRSRTGAPTRTALVSRPVCSKGASRRTYFKTGENSFEISFLCLLGFSHFYARTIFTLLLFRKQDFLLFVVR